MAPITWNEVISQRSFARIFSCTRSIDSGYRYQRLRGAIKKSTRPGHSQVVGVSMLHSGDSIDLTLRYSCLRTLLLCNSLQLPFHLSIRLFHLIYTKRNKVGDMTLSWAPQTKFFLVKGKYILFNVLYLPKKGGCEPHFYNIYIQEIYIFGAW